jgi:very-short-patch-repair endonuclease
MALLVCIHGRIPLAIIAPNPCIGRRHNVVDFFSPATILVIEMDGSQQLLQAEQDTQRTELLQSQGYRVVRFWNSQVLNHINGVVPAQLSVIARRAKPDVAISSSLAQA